MTAHDVVFLVVGLVTAVSAIMVVTSRHLMHAALFLALTLTGIGGVFLVLGAGFIALVQVVVYVGAVAVLFLFGLMLTRAPIGREALDSQNRGLGLAVAVTLFVLLAALIIPAFSGQSTADVTGPTIEAIGIAIFADWVLPFEVLSMLLLAALIGAILLARREAGESGTEAEVTRIEFGERLTDEPDRHEAVGSGSSAGELGAGGGR
jgi:NADH-quinone oxidoreductase subunit J